MIYDKSMIDLIVNTNTATITTILLKKGIRNTWIRGATPLAAGQPRVAGSAFTLRFIPVREDVATPDSWYAPFSIRSAIEEMPTGSIAVTDAVGATDAAPFGDIFCARMKFRGVAGLVTDGAVRDVVGIRSTGLPVWCAGAAAPMAIAGLTFAGWQEPIGCGGVAIYPNDLIVADEDGVIVVPSALAAEVSDLAGNQDALESWILDEVKSGHPLTGLYPPDDDNRARYEQIRNSAK